MHHPTILVVEDDRPVLDFLADLLGEEGFHVLTARDGELALYLANCRHPALVVADIGLPGINGIVLARRLRQVGIPVILISGGTRYLPLPGIDYLPKPLDINALLRDIDRALAPPAHHHPLPRLPRNRPKPTLAS